MDNDYDNDGNNIVPCPICLSAHCPSKEDGKCPEEDAFIKSMDNQYCKHCDHCGYIDCCGLRKFIDTHVRGKTNCEHEESILKELEEIIKWYLEK